MLEYWLILYELFSYIYNKLSFHMSNHWRTNDLKQTNLCQNFTNFSGETPRIRKTLLKLLFHYKLGALFFSRYSKRGESPKGRKMLNSCVAHRRLSPSVPYNTCASADSEPTWAPVWVLSRISLGVTDWPFDLWPPPPPPPQPLLTIKHLVCNDSFPLSTRKLEPTIRRT